MSNDEKERFASKMACGHDLGRKRLLEYLQSSEGASRFENLKNKGINPDILSDFLASFDQGFVCLEEFKNTYEKMFDSSGEKTEFLTHFEEQGISFDQLATVLSGQCKDEKGRFASKMAGTNVDGRNRLLLYLYSSEGSSRFENLKNKGINPESLSDWLASYNSGMFCLEQFKNTYEKMFDTSGEKTEFLTHFDEEGINFDQVATVLKGECSDEKGIFASKMAGSNVNGRNRLLFYLYGSEGSSRFENLKNKGINPESLSDWLASYNPGILCLEEFKNTYEKLFDSSGEKTEFLTHYEEQGISFDHIARLLKAEQELEVQRAFGTQ